MLETHSYTSKDGDYVVSQKKPKDRAISYAVLTDEDEFISMIEGRGKQAPSPIGGRFF